ncbi:MAG TPA: hypothetical protein VN375_15000 [Vicinamibacteria bacterium]|nr:hypothetical protein [Vicinamibacteria bacterium]
MPPQILADAPGLLALSALLLLPGALIVRAPWTAVPFLSVSFWIVTWWWLPGAGREGFLRAALLAFLVTVSLRLLKPLGLRPPRLPAMLVAVAALARLTPFFLWPVAPGADMSFHALSALLMVWRDGPPVTYEPLLPLHTFGAYPPGLHALAADVALLSGMAAHRAVFLVALAAQGLLHVAAFAFLKRFLAVPSAGWAACFAVGLARLPTALLGLGEGTSVLALALVLAASAHLIRGSDRSPAVAAGLFLGAAMVTHPPLMGAGALALGLALRPWRRDRRGHRSRLGLAALVALLAAGPFLLRLPLASLGRARWLHRVGALDLALPALALAVASALAYLIDRLMRGGALAARLTLLLLAVAACEGARRDALVEPRLVAGEDLAAMAWIRENTRPLDLICNRARPAGFWIPALAGRAVREPWLPLLYRDDPEARPRGPCAYTYGAGPLDPAARPLFRSGPVVVLEGEIAGP